MGSARLRDSNADTARFSVACDLEDAVGSKGKFTHRVVKEGARWDSGGDGCGVKYLEQAERNRPLNGAE